MGRFINADVYVSTGQGILGNNMFAYCNNNPVNACDPCGTCIHRWDFWNDCAQCGGETIVDKWDNFTGWCSDTFGAGVVLSNSYEQFAMDTLLGGVESGFSTSGTLFGDISKPISVYAENASDWWKITEYKVGIQINIGDGGFSFAYGMGETSASVSFGNETTIELISGINKLGATVSQGADFGSRTAETYYHAYIRSIPTAGLVLGTIYVSPMVLGLLGSGLVPVPG